MNIGTATPYDALADLRQKLDDDLTIKQAELSATQNEEAALTARLAAVQARKVAEQAQIGALLTYKDKLTEVATPPTPEAPPAGQG